MPVRDRRPGTNSRTRSTPRSISDLPIEFRSSGRGFTQDLRAKNQRTARDTRRAFTEIQRGDCGEGVASQHFRNHPPNRTCGGYASIDQNDPTRTSRSRLVDRLSLGDKLLKGFSLRRLQRYATASLAPAEASIRWFRSFRQAGGTPRT